MFEPHNICYVELKNYLKKNENGETCAAPGQDFRCAPLPAVPATL